MRQWSYHYGIIITAVFFEGPHSLYSNVDKSPLGSKIVNFEFVQIRRSFFSGDEPSGLLWRYNFHSLIQSIFLSSETIFSYAFQFCFLNIDPALSLCNIFCFCLFFLGLWKSKYKIFNEIRWLSTNLFRHVSIQF